LLFIPLFSNITASKINIFVITSSISPLFVQSYYIKSSLSIRQKLAENLFKPHFADKEIVRL